MKFSSDYKTYTYDAMGNRTNYRDTHADQLATTSTYNNLNQITQTSTANNSVTNYSHDADGNMTAASTSIPGVSAPATGATYSYDEENRLIAIAGLPASQTTQVPAYKYQFVYDGLSRLRISRYYERNSNNVLVLQNETRRVYDGMDIVQERDGNNNVTASYTRAGNIGGILARTTNAGSVFYGYDGSGNVTTLTNSAGAEVGSYTYDAFGNIVASSGTAAGDNPYRFSTKEQFGGLYSYGLRFYSPGLGRWINRDPIGEDGGTNLYGFVGNDPVNGVDEFGLFGFGVQGSSAVNGGAVTGISGGLGTGIGLATSSSAGIGVFGPLINPNMNNSSVGTYASSGGFARFGNKSAFTTTPAGQREGVFGADVGAGGSLFVTNADSAGQMSATDHVVNLNTPFLPIPDVPGAFWKGSVSFSWVGYLPMTNWRLPSGALVWQASAGPGAEFGPGSISEYGVSTIYSKSWSFATLYRKATQQYRNSCNSVKKGIW